MRMRAAPPSSEDRTMRTTWIVRWHGMDKACSGSAEAIDRWDVLDARGIEAQIFEVVAGERRRLVW
jgi:hypothetical protein